MPLDRILGPYISIQTLSSFLSNTNFTITFLSKKMPFDWYHPYRFPKFCLRTYHFPTVQPTPSISCLLVSLPGHNITQTVQVMHLVVQATRSLCPTKYNSEMPVPFCEHFFVVIVSPEIGWNKPLNIRDTHLLQVTR